MVPLSLFGGRLSELVPHKSFTVWIGSRTEGKVRAIYHSDPESRPSVLKYSFPVGEGATGRAIAEGRPVISNHQHGADLAKYIPGTSVSPEHLLVVAMPLTLVAVTVRRDAKDAEFGEDQIVPVETLVVGSMLGELRGEGLALPA